LRENLQLIKPLKAFRRISAVQQEKLLSECLKSGRNDIYLIVLTALRTGLRRSEILSLYWKDIDLDEKLITVHKTKNGHHRTVPITNDLLKAFSKFLKSEEDRVFTLSANAVRLAFDRIRQKAEMNEVRFHDLRHEAISFFFEMGLTVPEVAMISGHRTLSMLMRYSHGQLDRVRSIISC
tara:strand:- start:85 stop:624 length:540 start_codon:yes stop_codon:yes gene_type:complete